MLAASCPTISASPRTCGSTTNFLPVFFATVANKREMGTPFSKCLAPAVASLALSGDDVRSGVACALAAPVRLNNTLAMLAIHVVFIGVSGVSIWDVIDVGWLRRPR